MSAYKKARLPDLWEHQRKAIKIIRKYISNFQSGLTNGSCLIHMPTGSGKTGVMASVARCLPEVKHSLILAPRVVLRKQLYEDVKVRFFYKLNFVPDVKKECIIKLDKSFPKLDTDIFDSIIIISTYQKLNWIAKNDFHQFEMLSKLNPVIMVDEAHYEPAPEWSKTIRQIHVPKIIFTATPYRNDLKVFDLDMKYAYSYTFHQARKDLFLREVEFIPMKQKDNPNDFVDDVIEFYESHFDHDVSDPPRVIIRCDQKGSILHIGESLIQRGKSCIALHEKFTSDSEFPWAKKYVPDPKHEEATYWIHQFKLLEGIDDPRFQMLALYEPLNTARSFVQQVGRIIRNPGREPGTKAYVLDHSNNRQKKLWQGFLDYDEELSKQGIENLKLAVGEGIVEHFMKSQISTAYIDGQFRRPFDLDNIDPWDELRLPLAVNLFNKSDEFDINELCGLIEKDFVIHDRNYRYFRENNTIVFIYITYENSRFLHSTCFIEPRLGITIFHEMDKYLAFYDSTGYRPVQSSTTKIRNSVAPDLLQKLFTKKEKSRLTSISLRNSELGITAIQTRSFTAASVERTAPGFHDYAQICTNVRGYSTESHGQMISLVRRYVGFQRGRVSESTSDRCTLDEYLEWLESLQVSIDRRRKCLETFNRYATVTKEPHDPEPMSILLDLLDVEEVYLTLGSGKVPQDRPLHIKELCRKVRKCTPGERKRYSLDPNQRVFYLTANGINLLIKINYNKESQRYYLESKKLQSMYYSKNPQFKKDLVTYLNHSQSFMIIPKSENAIYSAGRFFNPLMRVGKSFNPDDFIIANVMRVSPVLKNISSEKGKQCLIDGKGWENNCLFQIIDDLGTECELQKDFGKPDIVVCDDMCTEVADFILADSSKKKVIFIHAKASKDFKPYSASVLQEVCGQATKNIGYLAMFNEARPSNLNKWGGKWSAKGTKGFVKKRIRKGVGSGDKIWEKVRSIIRDPLADREAWLFLGNILSKQRFLRELGKVPPTAEAIQAVYLLQSTLTNVASIGVKLRVFCSP